RRQAGGHLRAARQAQLALQLPALALGALRLLVAEDQRLEGVLTLLADVLVQRHGERSSRSATEVAPYKPVISSAGAWGPRWPCAAPGARPRSGPPCRRAGSWPGWRRAAPRAVRLRRRAAPAAPPRGPGPAHPRPRGRGEAAAASPSGPTSATAPPSPSAASPASSTKSRTPPRPGGRS